MIKQKQNSGSNDDFRKTKMYIYYITVKESKDLLDPNVILM